jgi:SPP1 gp7 family putative phage head morphogenesis protein
VTVPATNANDAPVFKAGNVLDRMTANMPGPVTLTDPEKAKTFGEAMDAARAQGEISGGIYSPGMPLTPFDGVSGLPRAWNFPTGYNIKSRADRDGRMAFDLLKALTENYDVASMCINHRIDDVRSLNWTVRAADWAETDDPASIAAARKALKRPDGVNPFRSWLAMFLGDILRYDAGALYRRRNMMGDVIGLEVVSGMTIAPVLDYYGRRPAAPAPAYVQYVNGQPWEWLTADDLIYVPFRPQSDSPYGQAPLEAVLLTANTHMRFQKHYLDWFTEGNIPEGFATAPQDITTPEQLAKWQEYWSAMNTGDTSAKHQLRMIPHGTVLEFPKEQDFNPEFPLYLMRIVCAAFHVTPNDLGFTDDVNRATGDTQVDVQFRIGTLPLIRHVEDILTDYLQDDLGLPVVFEFDTGQETEDRVATAQADKIYVEMGAISVDEVREREFGLATDAERPTPRFIYSARQGPIPLRSLLDVAGPVDPQTAAPDESVPLDLSPYNGTPGILPDKSPGAPQFARAPVNPDEPERPQLEGEVPGSGLVGPPPTPPVAKSARSGAVLRELAKWQANTATRLARGQRPRRFAPEVTPEPVIDAVWKQLRHVTDKARADMLFAVAKASLDTEQLDDIEYDVDSGEIEYDAKTHELGLNDDDPGASLAQVEEEDLEALEDDGHPKGWRADTAQPSPQQQVDLKLTDHWAPKVLGAFGSLYTMDQLKGYAKQAREIASFDRLAAARGMDDTHLKEVMDGMWADAYNVGKMAGQVSIFGPDDDWSNWRPGQLGESPRLSDLGWMDAIKSKGLALKGINDTTLDLIGNHIDKGIKDGLSVDQLARNLRDVIKDPDRAEMVAHTESARMLTAASLTQYREAGIADWDLVTSAGACPTCLSVEMDNPHNAFDDESTPPIHPRCRCSVSPHGDPLSTGGVFSARGSDPGKVALDGEEIDVIGEDDKRGNARPVGIDEYAQVAGQGKAILDDLRANSSDPDGLLKNLDDIKASTYDQILQSWGGSTIDSHTGEALASDANKFAVTVKPEGYETVSVGENPTREEWDKAMDQAVARFGDVLSAQSHYLGVFHDDDLKRVDIDPVVVVDKQADSEAIGAYTHNIGGAYNFADGNGYWPPYVQGVTNGSGADVAAGEPVAKAGRPKVRTHFRGIGEWYGQARRLNDGA